ncbi:MAG: hypothetical protein HQL31_09220 [Planctomycetes bacterium]|nr:hypothetical protein [Planctomycetota bacterium]
MTTAQAQIFAGICGFETAVKAESEDQQMVSFCIESDCAKVCSMAEVITRLGPVDAYAEIDPSGTGVLMEAMRGVLKGCCSGCAVPVGVFKSMQVSAGLALPREVHISLTRS